MERIRRWTGCRGARGLCEKVAKPVAAHAGRRPFRVVSTSGCDVLAKFARILAKRRKTDGSVCRTAAGLRGFCRRVRYFCEVRADFVKTSQNRWHRLQDGGHFSWFLPTVAMFWQSSRGFGQNVAKPVATRCVTFSATWR